MRLDGRMEVVHAGEAKPERTGPTHLCSLMSQPSSPCPLVPPTLAVSDFSGALLPQDLCTVLFA